MKVFYIKGSTPKWDITGRDGMVFPIIAWLIRLATWSKISHVFYDFASKGKLWEVQLIKRVIEDRLSITSKGIAIKYIFEIRVPDDKLEELWKFLEPQVGDQLGYLVELVGIALVLPFRIFGLYLNNPLRKIYGNSQTCSENIARSFKEVLRLDWFDSIPFSTLTERDVIEILDKHRGKYSTINVRRLR